MIAPHLKPKDQKRKRKAKNHSIRNKRRTKRGMVLDLDKWARREIVELRDDNICQVCSVRLGEINPQTGRLAVIQWCHFHTREYYVTRWAPENSFAGCDVCHVRFDNNKVIWFDWYEKKWPDRAQMVRRVLQGDCKTTDADIKAMWLENRGRENGD